MQRTMIAGAGAFGTALALVARRAGRTATLWTADAEQAEAMREGRSNDAFLPGVSIPDGIAISANPADLHDADVLLLAVPSQATRDLLQHLRSDVPPTIPVVACAKGLERTTGRLQTSIIAELLPEARPAVLSGPGFAGEIARGLPTAVTIAAADIAQARALCTALAADTFRPYASDDRIGVELGGSVKNVLAIAAGIVVGRGLGESARAALITRGLAEMMRLGAALGARAETFMGLSGLGDLVLTATSERSRNLAFGVALGRGQRTVDLLAAGMPLAEGAHTARIAAELANGHGVETPIISAVAAIIDGALSVDAAIGNLVSRPLKTESEAAIGV